MDFYGQETNVMKFVGLNALAALGAAATVGAKIPAVTIGPKKAKLTKEDFGDLRIYFEGATDQVKSMTAGSLLLEARNAAASAASASGREFMVDRAGHG